jgi:hypothetical protein
MVDNGYVFEGPQWRFSDTTAQGLYFRPMVYGGVSGWGSFEPWLERIVHFPEDMVDHALKQIPPPWIEGEEDQIEKLLDALLRRRKRVPELIEACRGSKSNPFPNWR